MFGILKTLFITILIGSTLFFSHTIVTIMFFFPFNQIDIVYLYLLWQIVHRGNLAALYISLPVYFLTTLFSSSVFGLIAMSSLLSVIMARKLFYVFFTAHSWYSIFILGLVGMTIQKILLFIFTIALPLLSGNSAVSADLNYLYASLFEIGINAAIFLLFYAVITLLKPKRYYQYTV